jgi:hypothetical protein
VQCYLTDGERIVEQWIQQDLWWRSRASPTGLLQNRVRAQLERSFTAQTSAANLAGMGRVMSFKNSMMLTAPRIFGLITLLAPDAVQTAWEAEGIVFWPTLSAIPRFSRAPFGAW